MKRNIILAFLLLAFSSCSKDWDGGGDIPPAMGFINLSVTDKLDSGEDISEYIKKVRFIVLTDLTSYPKIEVNEFEEINSERADTLKVVLKVTRTETGMNNKLLVVIANEPGSMTEALNNMKTLQDLENIRMDMGKFISTNHQSFQTDSVMPMSGAVWTENKVYRTVKEAENNRVTLSLERALAKVEVYVNNDYTDKLKIAAGSTVTLGNTCTESYFIRHKSGDKVLGKIQTVESESLISKVWTQTDDLLEVPRKPNDPSSSSEPEPICTFYTPERNCSLDTDKLRLNVSFKVDGDNGFKSGGMFLNTEGNGQAINVVERNTIYKVTVTIGMNEITATVNDWKNEEIPTDL